MKETDEKRGLSRRSFLRTTAGTLAVTGFTGIGTLRAAEAGKLATLIDLSLCDGCPTMTVPACVSACRDLNRDTIPAIADPIPVPWPRKTVEDWSDRREISDRLTPYNYLYVHRVEIDQGGRQRTLFVPRRCMHCDNPACATICPFSANHKFENGAVVINQNRCFGGAKCKAVCPWKIPQRQSGVGIYLHILPDYMGNGVMYKCDLCHDRLTRGEQPACIEACPRQAMLIGPREEILAEAEGRARNMRGYLYGKDENGGTSTIYVSPVSFDLINASMAREPGRPGMKPGVKREMAESDGLGKAVLAAPALGAVVGAAGAFRWLAGRKTRLVKEGKNNG
ncbi:MAG: 4Fe-4S dicluster domain-containing protein [Deltaproteobacteria bacterium]|nr:4Fe-4S dicluster domain-containing protein [Deltaproteobacteria bacterium]